MSDFGGTRIFVPKSVGPEHALSQSIGQIQANKLCAEAAGVHAYIPKEMPDRQGRRRAIVLSLIGERHTIPQIARRVGFSERVIGRDIAALRAEGFVIDRKRNNRGTSKC